MEKMPEHAIHVTKGETVTITKDYVTELFESLEKGDADEFFNNVSPEVDWTVMGTHPLAGRYTSRDEFRQATFERLTPCLEDPIRLSLVNVLVDGDDAAVELRAISKARSGWQFDNRYCWVVSFKDGVIVQVRAYLDSAMVAKLISENEYGFYR